MNTIRNIIIKHIEEIIVGLIITIITTIFTIIAKYVKRVGKKLSPKTLPIPEKKSVYLNTPKRVLKDFCVGRDGLLEKVYKAIINNKELLPPNRHIAITGMEGMGKTLFCQILFNQNLHYSNIYLGWIECNGCQSIFDIMKSSIHDPRFYRKNKQTIISNLNELDKPCVLFVDQVDQNTPISELEELSVCPNVILIVAGLLKKINWIDDKYTYSLPPLSDEYVLNIFQRKSGEVIEFMEHKNKKAVKSFLDLYANGNPFLIVAFAKAKEHYNGKWDEMFENMLQREYSDDKYLKDILRQLYKINQLNQLEKLTLSKLSLIPYAGFVEAVFKWLDIPSYCVERLSKTHWLSRDDSILYSMDKTHRDVIIKVLSSEENLRNAILSINISLSRWKTHQDNGFRWISLYVEDILKKIQGYAPQLMEERIFSDFVWKVASKYENISNNEKVLEWIELCKPQSTELAFRKAYLEFRIKAAFINSLFSYNEVMEIYYDTQEKVKATKDCENNKRFLIQEYCYFLNNEEKGFETIKICNKYFKKYPLDFSDEYNLDMFMRYLQAANDIEDEESLKLLVNNANLRSLEENEKVSITAAWSFGELGEIFEKWGNKKMSEKYMRHMVILLNEQRSFFHKDIKGFLKMSEEQFAEYMHSCDELLDSLNEALQREDPEALYIEGRYQEKQGNYEEAFALYEKAAMRDSLRGMCSLALLYYRGQGETQNIEKAYKYWNYCCEREHRGSYYWRGILFLDEKYYYYDDEKYCYYNKEEALKNLTKASELGSERAKQKLAELQKT